MSDVTIIGISGSTRKASFNTALLQAAKDFMPAGVKLEIVSIKDIPLYDGDLEAAEGIPAAVTKIKDLIAGAQGLLLASPEYNAGIPGVVKNAIDWMSRPASDIGRVFAGKPVGLIGATPGQSGTRFAQTAWLPVFRNLNLQPWFGKQICVSGASKVFDESGKLVDDTVKGLLKGYVEQFAKFVSVVAAR